MKSLQRRYFAKASQPKQSRLGLLIAMISLIIAAAVGIGGMQGAPRSVASPARVASSPPPAPQLERIQDIRCGRRVLAQNPSAEIAEEEDLEEWGEPDPATWRHLQLEMFKDDGSRLSIELLRPDWWIEECRAVVGETVDLELAELGAEGPATVLAIGPCPLIHPGNGRVVTGTFRHESAIVVDLAVEGLDEPIGVTANHLFWSADREDFVPVGELKEGERLADLEGTPGVVSITPRIGAHTVYNLEVQFDHTYHVSASGVLVHNAYSGLVTGSMKSLSLGRLKGVRGRLKGVRDR